MRLPKALTRLRYIYSRVAKSTVLGGAANGSRQEPGFCMMKRVGVLLPPPPPGWDTYKMLVHCRSPKGRS